MTTHKGKDEAPEGQTKKTLFTGEDDVEGHNRRMPRDAEPDGQTKKTLYTGEDDDVEGHKLLPK
jgi:hypothetical protein